mgnify:CR=1 FL=1
MREVEAVGSSSAFGRLLGLEIVDEFDNTEDMRKLARRRWQKRASALGLIEDDASSNPGN